MCKMLHNEKSYLINSQSDQQTKLLKENERRGFSRERVVGQGVQRATADLCDRFQGQGGGGRGAGRGASRGAGRGAGRGMQKHREQEECRSF